MHPPTIGPYRALSPLAGGGMGMVWRAEDLRDGRIVALKTILGPDPALVASLRREISALARARHPGIVTILDSGVHEGLPWYAMELVNGEPLRAWVPRPTEAPTRTAAATWSPDVDAPPTRPAPAARTLVPEVPLEERLRVVAELCDALAALHAEGLVHRDLKPENVIVRRDGSPVLVDFGLSARTTGRTGREAADVHAVGGGTVGYVAPEQIRRERVDARADLYALGCVLYEMVCGRPPFTGSSNDEVLQQHLNAQPLPPSQRGAAVPLALDDVVMRLLAKRPSRRFAYASDVTRALAALGAPVKASAGAGRPYLYRPDLVGRDDVLARLAPKVAGLAQRRGGLALIGGESGMGKTRLATGIAGRAVRGGAASVVLECPPPGHGATGSVALKAVLAAVADRCATRDPSILGADGPWLAWFDPAFRAWAEPADTRSVPEGLARVKLWEALFDALLRAFAPKPVVLVVDDLQWADPLVSGWIEHIASTGRLQRAPVLVLATWRAEEPTSAIGRLRAYGEDVRLEPLPDDAIGVLVGDMLATTPPPEALARAVAGRAGGSPFFAAELVQEAIGRGLLHRDGEGRWTDGDDVGDRLPASIGETLAARADALGEGGRAVLEAGAVLGRRFSLENLAAVAGVSEADASVVAAEALRRQLLEDAGAELAFVHDRIREVVYARIAPDRRAALHLVAADRSAAIGANEAAGAHYAAAGRPDRASMELCAAARKASGRAAYDDADRLYDLAITHASPDEVLRLRLERIAETYEPRGRYREAAAEAEAVAAEATAPVTSIGAHRAIGRLLYRQGRHAEAVEPLRRTLTLADAHGDPVPIRGALNNLAVVLRELGHLDEARELFLREERLWADEPMSRERAQCVGNLAMIDQFVGRLADADERLAEVLAIQNALPDAALDQNITLWNVFSGALVRYDWTRGERLANETLQLSLHLGDRVGEASAWWGLALCRAELGRYDEAEEAARRSMAAYAELGNPRDAAGSEALLGIVAFRAGRFDAAEAMLERSREALVAASYASEIWRVTLELAALVRVARGDLARADALLDGIAGLARPLERSRWPAARGLVAVARGEPAERWLREAERAHGACDLPLDAHPEARALRLALDAIGSGRPELLRNGEPVELLTPAQRAALGVG